MERDIWKKYKNQGVVVLGLAIQENVPDPSVKLKAFRKKHKLTYRLLSDEKLEVANRFGVEGVPTLLVLDRRGVYVANPADVKELATTVEQLLKKGSPGLNRQDTEIK